MNYAYIRVSTDRQTVENQRYEIQCFAQHHDLKIDIWINETISGTVPFANRMLGRLLKCLHPGDLILCTEISRLGRSLFMILDVLNRCLSRGARLWTIKDNYRLGDDITSKVLAFAFGLSAEIERNLIALRTREALARTRANGKRLGRSPGYRPRRKLEEKEARIKRLLQRGYSISRIARLLHVHRQTLSRYINTSTHLRTHLPPQQNA